VQKHEAFELEDAIRKMEFVPASIVGFADRGLLHPD
jgi:N-acyl-D-aspartate/D-glutamate deacylase